MPGTFPAPHDVVIETDHLGGGVKVVAEGTMISAETAKQYGIKVPGDAADAPKAEAPKPAGKRTAKTESRPKPQGENRSKAPKA